MLPDDTRQKVAHIIRGNVLEGYTDTITTIRNVLCTIYPTSRTVKEDFEGKLRVKEEQADFLINYCKSNNLLINILPSDEQFITRGGEALIYLAAEGRTVIKVNDAVYYATWLEFLNSVLLHNLFFSNTAYELLGFAIKENILVAVLQQPLITSDELVELRDIREFLEFNGFKNTKRQDYENPELGLILEDMHDENVLSSEGVLFFIDSVFYITSPK
jgi:hypothetical protein